MMDDPPGSLGHVLGDGPEDALHHGEVLEVLVSLEQRLPLRPGKEMKTPFTLTANALAGMDVEAEDGRGRTEQSSTRMQPALHMSHG